SLSLVGLTTPSACSHSLRCNLHYVALGIWPSIGLWGYAPIASMILTKRINRGLRFIFPACRNADYRRLKLSLEYCSHAPVGCHDGGLATHSRRRTAPWLQGFPYRPKVP